MRRLIAATTLAANVLLLAGCKPSEAPVANDSVEPAAEPVANMVDDRNLAESVDVPPPPPPPPPPPTSTPPDTTDGSDDRVSGD